MRSTLAAVGGFVDSVPRSNNVVWRERILEFLRGRPDIDSSGECGVLSEDQYHRPLWSARIHVRAGKPGGIADQSPL